MPAHSAQPETAHQHNPAPAQQHASWIALHQLATSLGNTVDAKDSETYNHSHEVADISEILARALQLSSDDVEAIHIAGHLHDIGKIGIPDSILKKQGPLTDEEWCWMKKHPEMGAKIIMPVEAFNISGITNMVLCHHERFDGTGYPNRLRGDAIPLGARIIAVADTLSALLQNRPYRKGCSFPEAMAEIIRCSGTQLDPVVVTALIGCQQELLQFFGAHVLHSPQT